jgi:hypothetical protein
MTQEEQILMNNINKRFKTTMIGALARFEDSFGYLWEDENNPNSENFNILWERVRDEILNNGNKQLRATINEVSNFISKDVKINRTYNYDISFDNKNNNNNNKGENYEN